MNDLSERLEDDNGYEKYAKNELIIPPLFVDYLYHIFSAWKGYFNSFSRLTEQVFWEFLFYRNYSNDANRDY